MSVSVKKIFGVESVDVKLKQGKAFIHLKPGNTVRLEDITQKVRDNGFHPQDANVSARGELVTSAGKLQLKITGPNQTYDLAGDAAKLAELKKNVGKVVIIDGSAPAPKDKSASQLIQVITFKLEP